MARLHGLGRRRCEQRQTRWVRDDERIGVDAARAPTLGNQHCRVFTQSFSGNGLRQRRDHQCCSSKRL